MHDDISFLTPPQLAEHCEVADQSDQVGHGEVLQFANLVRNNEPLLPEENYTLLYRQKYIIDTTLVLYRYINSGIISYLLKFANNEFM